MRFPTRPSRSFVFAAGLVVLMSLLEMPAEAAFPGQNGRIAFARARSHEGLPRVWTAGMHGNNVQRLRARNGTNPAWSPDGSRIVFEHLVGGPRSTTEQLIVTDDDGDKTHIALTGEGISNPSWAPGGTKIVFESGPPDGGIAVVGSHGQDLHVIAAPSGAGTFHDPVWSPDGSRIAFQRCHRMACRIWSVHPDGSGLRRITNGDAADASPDWSSDGKHLVFSRSISPTESDLFLVRRNGSREIQLTSTTEADSEPAFSPNGQRIIFSSCCYGDSMTSELFTMTVHGTRVRRITSNEADDTAPSWGAFPHGTPETSR
jgi:Tol biopolymer transport system component